MPAKSTGRVTVIDVTEGTEPKLIRSGAIDFDEKAKRALIDQSKCYGCGNCLLACRFEALNLVARKEIPALAGNY